LPYSEDAYNNQEDVLSRFWLEDSVAGENDPSSATTLSTMAHLVEVITIWGSVLANIYREAQRPRNPSAEEIDAFYQKMRKRLEDWRTNLPAKIAFSEENLRTHAEAGFCGTFIATHTLYHAVSMKLHRYVPQNRVPSSSVIERVGRCNKHARELLNMMRVYNEARAASESEGGPSYAMFAPFVGYAVTSACDIISAKGLKSQLAGDLDLLDDGLEILMTLKPHWKTSRVHRRMVENRIKELREVLAKHNETFTTEGSDQGSPNSMNSPRMMLYTTAKSLEGCWVPIEDLAYSAPEEYYLQALCQDLTSTLGLSVGQ
jgi:hypothetical protein